jgi:N-carbamoylputrescine amidase
MLVFFFPDNRTVLAMSVESAQAWCCEQTDSLVDRVGKVTVAATQFACSWSITENLEKAESLVRACAASGAQIVLLQELFSAQYFCQTQEPDLFKLALPADESTNPILQRFSRLAAELEVVLPVSFFERANKAFFNSLIVFDADGKNLGLYRKTHIPDGPGYQEKFYFNPGDTGFKVFSTKYCKIGVAICWDQWFPEAARIMALQGADVLLYPTAIGSEPQDPTIDSKDHWVTTMRGHAAANLCPLVASNRVGKEQLNNFYGSSFIADFMGQIVSQMDASKEGFICASFDIAEIRVARSSWGLFRDRRPELYGPLISLDGFPRMKNDFPKSKSVPSVDGFRFLAEFSQHECCWIGWPKRTDVWRDSCGPARAVFAQVVQTISQFEPVKVVIQESDILEARKLIETKSTKFPVSFITLDYDDVWLRDTGALFLVSDNGTLGALDFYFNAWGEKVPQYEADIGVAERMSSLTRAIHYKVPMVLEGGSFGVDGEGTLITTEECLLNKNRNPRMTKSEIEHFLCMYVNVSKVIWLPFGVYCDM